MTDQHHDMDRHPFQAAEVDILPTINTSISSGESSKDDYDEVIIFGTKARAGGDQSLKDTEDVHDDDDREAITFEDTKTATEQESITEPAATTAAASDAQTTRRPTPPLTRSTKRNK